MSHSDHVEEGSVFLEKKKSLTDHQQGFDLSDM